MGKGLGTTPSRVKPHEAALITSLKNDDSLWRRPMGLNITAESERLGFKIPLSKVLDRRCSYLWVWAGDEEGVDPENGELVIGYEYTRDSERYGHPTLAVMSGGMNLRCMMGGELRYEEQLRGWYIDNNSGRYGSGNISRRHELVVPKSRVLRSAVLKFRAETDLGIKYFVKYSEKTVKRWLQQTFSIGGKGTHMFTRTYVP